MLPSYGPKDSADPGSHADVDDHLPPTLSSWADGTAASSGRKPRDRSTQDVAPDQTQHPDRLVRRATSSQALGLPSSYPSTIASSWSRPERSVWFQSKAIIITSIFLAIFIVLFIGAAVFLRDRKHDDAQLEESDEAQFEWMKSERRQAGLGEDGSGGDKEGNHPNQKGKRSKIKKALGLAPLKEKAEDNSAGVDRDTSTGSSSTVRRRHLASRWARIHARKKADSHETFVGSDTASIRSSRSNRRLTLGDPASSSERVEIIYDDNSAGDTRADEDARRSVSSQEGVSSTEAERGNEPSPPPRTEHRHADAVAGLDANDVHSLRAPPTPPPQSDPQQASDRNVGSTNLDRGSVLPRRREAALDHDDFQAAEEAEAEEHRAQQMPPAYLPSGSEATGSRAMGSGPPNDRSPYYGNASASMAHALAHGDEKSGIPPPDERDRDLPPEVLGAALRGMDAQYEADPVTAVGASTSRDTAHVAVDDKETLGALYAATSMPETDRPASMADVSSAPAYAPDAVVTAEAGTSAPSAPSAPEIDLDAEGFERLSRESARDPAGSAEAEDARSARRPSTPQGKGKGKIDLGLLPAPPRPLDPAFSPFDQPYRRDGPPNRSASSSPLPGSCPSSSWPLGGVESPSDANPSSVAKGKRPAEGASSASESDKQREAEAELAQYLASAPGDLLASAGIAPVSSVYLDRSAASAPAFESLPAYNRTDSSQPLLPSAPPSGDDDDDDDAGSRYEPFARLASSQASLGPSAPSQQGHLDESGETSEVGRRLPAPSAPSAPTPDLD